MSEEFIPVAQPALVGNERKYVLECVDTTWISSNGRFVTDFESAFAEFCGVGHAVACNTGTAALHLALCVLGIKPGDEVILPSLTFVATAHAVTYCGAVPVFVDSQEGSWNLRPKAVAQAITSRTRAIMPVHLFGCPADMAELRTIAEKRGIPIVEDAAEAVGAEYGGRRVGGIGRVAAFSLFGNKIITSGEGGVLTTDDAGLAQAARLFRNQGMDPKRRYWHTSLGFNYRITNLAAAVALGQLEKIEWHLAARLAVRRWYDAVLADDPAIKLQSLPSTGRHVHWMVAAELLGLNEADRDRVIEVLRDERIETRPLFYPIHTMPSYQGTGSGPGLLPVATRVAATGIVLPTYATLTEAQIRRVVISLKAALRRIATERPAR